MQYNKLVRDKIPQIIFENEGKNSQTSILEGKALQEALLRKLDEEIAEYKEAYSDEEMADILEVLYALAGNSDSAWESERKSAYRSEINVAVLNKVFSWRALPTSRVLALSAIVEKQTNTVQNCEAI